MIEVRALDPGDVEAAYRQSRTAFGAGNLEWTRTRAEMGLYIAAYDAARLVGVAALHPYRQWFAGRDLPMTGLAGVSVAPHARRRGVARAMLSSALTRMAEDGTAISALYPSSPPVYRALGWEMAGVYAGADLPTSALTRIPSTGDVTLRPAEKSDVDAVHALYTAAVRPAVGPLTRTGPLFDLDDMLELDGLLLAERAGAPAGYVSFTRGGDPGLKVHDLVGGDPEVLSALLQAVGSWETVTDTVRVRTGDPSVLSILSPAKPHLRWDELWMARLVDVQKAVTGRGWPAAVRVGADIDLIDPDAPWHAGRWRLEVADGSGTLERGGTGAVQLHIRGLSALFTGFASTVSLRATGLLDGDPTTAARLDAAFAGQTPWMVDYF